MKMLNGLIKPDKGKIYMRGRVGALIEWGVGFNPILTGRENIYINGSVLGFTKEEIKEKFESILEFAEIGEFIDTPVQNYSSGMRVRLGFAVAAHMEPDVLLVDEVLAVGDGDLGFRVKCLNAIGELLNNASVVFVSHAMPQISKVSTKAILMEKGSCKMYTEDVSRCIDLYYQRFDTAQTRNYPSDKVKLCSSQLIGPVSSSANLNTPIIQYEESFTLMFTLAIDPSMTNSPIDLLHSTV